MTAQTLPTANELKETFNLFLNRCIELLADVDRRKELFVFSAVNAQICLELFLKYYYFRLNKKSEVLATKNGIQSNTFNEFQQILNHFFATSTVTHTSKKELERIGRLRNSIVHRAQDASYQEDLCQSIVATLYFVHTISAHDLGEPIILATEFPQRVQKLRPWRRAAIGFASKLCDKPAVCLHCGEAAVVSGEVLTFEPATTDDDVVCLCCLSYLEVARSVALLQCIDCCEMAVYVDRLNPQERGNFPARCSNCGLRPEAFDCAECGKIGLHFHLGEGDPICFKCDAK